MKLFAGLSRTDYQDLLRAVGALIDERQLRDVRFWEHEDGIVLQGRRYAATGDAYETVLLTDDDLSVMLAGAYRRRGESPPSAGRAGR
jgi:hypothetical protein